MQLSVTPTEGLVGSVLTVTWERNSDGGFSNLDYLALFDAADETFDAPYAYQFAQPSAVKVIPSLLLGQSIDSINKVCNRNICCFTFLFFFEMIVCVWVLLS